jgi:hypothetical protein
MDLGADNAFSEKKPSRANSIFFFWLLLNAPIVFLSLVISAIVGQRGGGGGTANGLSQAVSQDGLKPQA